MSGPRYLVLNRFDDEFGEYHRFIDEAEGRLAYLTTAHGAHVLDHRSALDVVVVPDLSLATVLPQARLLADRHGPFTGVVGLSEHDLLTAAALRVELGAAGWSPDFVLRFRDKPRMKEAVTRAGLRVPRFLALNRDSDPAEVAAAVGLPAILKPRDGDSSRGVVRVDTVAELAGQMALVDLDTYECEEFIDGELLHVDGLRRSGAFHFVRASLYLKGCWDFARGEPYASAVLDPGPEVDRIAAFTAGCLDGLGLADGPFHLELFRGRTGELVFLEVGLRPGGGEVAFVHRDVYGIDLFEEGFRATIGLPPRCAPIPPDSGPNGGWIGFPEPRPWPAEVVSRTPLLGVVPELYDEVLPSPGDVLDGTGGYDRIGGRFRLRGPDHDSVCRAIARIMDSYRLVTRPALPCTDEVPGARPPADEVPDAREPAPAESVAPGDPVAAQA